MIAMIVVGFVIAPFFVLWDAKFAKHPVIPVRFYRNRSVWIASAIGFFDFVRLPSQCLPFRPNYSWSSTQISFYLTFIYLFSFVIVVKPW